MTDCPHYSTRIAERRRLIKTLSCDHCPETWTIRHPIHGTSYDVKNLLAGLIAIAILMAAFIISSAKAFAGTAYPPPVPSTGVYTHPVSSASHHVVHIHHLAQTGVNAQNLIALAVILLLVGGGILLVSYSRKRSH